MYAARRQVLALLHAQKLNVEEAEEMLDLIEAQHRAPTPTIPKPEFIGDSEWARQFRQTLQKTAAIDAPVLIQGEPGTGKMVVARIIHYNSRRASGPFVNVECPNAEATIAAELFGRGEQRGALEQANGGTLVLGSPEMLSLEIQRQLCHFLAEGYFTRVGDATPSHADVRLIATAHRALQPLVDAGTLLPELYYRLSVSTAQVAPLRQLPEDLPVLAEFFLQQQSKDRRPPTLSAEASQALQQYDWPANTAELCHVIGSAAVNCDGDQIRPEHLPALGEYRHSGLELLGAS